MSSIQSVILKAAKSALAASLGIAAFGFIVYSVFALRKTEQQAMRFITSHVTALAEAGINSQNVNEIDKEIGRFTQTWKETQDLDLRVDILLDGRLVSHAGQLQPFGVFHTLVEQTTALPSGEQLVIWVEISLIGMIESGILLMACFGTLIATVFALQMRLLKRSINRISQPLETQVAWLRQIANDLPDSARSQAAPADSSDISEMNDLSSSIVSLLKQIVALENSVAIAAQNGLRVQLAEEVAHSIKGVIATLQLKTDRLTSLSAKERRELADCIGALRDISRNLLVPEQGVASLTAHNNESVHILAVARTVVASKQAQYENQSLHFELKNESALFGGFCALSNGELQSVLATLLDNAAEASAPGGRIVIDGIRAEKEIRFRVSDEGRGIPPQLLDRLLKERITFDKANGNGIGLVHAKATLARIGGSISIESAVGKGTRVELRIPESQTQDLFSQQIEVPRSGEVVIVDDDELIHSVWKQKLGLQGALAVVSLRSREEFERWMQLNGHGVFGQRLYLFDCDLKDPSGNGLDLIEKFGLAFESVLVSGMVEDTDVRLRTKKLGVKWLSKDYLSIVPIYQGGLSEKASFLSVVQ